MDEYLKIAYSFYIDESTDSIIYKHLASIENIEELKDEFIRLSKVEADHALFWKKFLEKRGVKVEPPKVSSIKLIYAKLLRKLLGAGVTVSILELGEAQAVNKYYKYIKETQNLEPEEIDGIKQIIFEELEHEKVFAEEKKKFHTENVRDFVLGMNDGLVEILGAVFGLSAVYPTKPYLVGFSGLIVGVAGALSMGVGTFVSVRSQRQINESLRRNMEILLDVAPDIAAEKNKEKLVENGIPEDIAQEIVSKLKEKGLLKALLPEEEDTSEIRAGLYTGLAYLFGIFFSVIPFFLSPTSYTALIFSVILAGVALATVGTLVAMFSGIDTKKKAIEMLTAGLGAAVISYGFGTLMNSIFGIANL